jgi:selenocysteine lyase/cysteine desulfurase
VYGPLDDRQRGATIAMNFYDSTEKIIDHRRVEQAAAKRQISLRSGCFCNPGGGETALRLSKSELIGCFRQHGEVNSRFTQEDFRHCVDSKETGAVRISLGIVSNFEDVRRFVEFAGEFLG